MSRKLLTLAISQSGEDEFFVICYDELKCRLVSIELHRDEIIKHDNVYFDIGAVTEVENLREGDFVYPVGARSITHRYSRQQLKDFFDREAVNIEAFKINRNVEKFSIIKITSVHELYVRTGKLRMKFWSNGVRNDYIIKDVRWVSYVERHLMKNSLLERLDDYKNLVNNKQKSTFAILYKYEKYNVEWIAGLHWL
ncbi:hypothetical protein [Halalkalibacter urbisdiaboli]|uniref:hypothetical protein n=1 Tax=Halalkalibacter urbisdiaboli TaxID=1960589 RepID=UPI000B434C43|nr:hypothetical protein [Halalkalibacter urbisdiaboli]